ncbi:hypothetical protein ABB37_09219 [Leptomonas pyrrhocoris]|uniref:Surface antigen protein 2 n=1 Tax=Leptomonas pyrrhocoris TaxID=157538 RepID=A0A0M9FRU7_LEPPY|nr:hypothetical protein ABB37_09216 [Leptomonas pyrrhocoris]XP_015653025.1 hypothetical protein ABB37_09216 [Leptomonas pyrrhocoris]XP_015653028.1 hypothetical protein ABB37_09219 [Leptomonas pyrrhocoris]KPA74585.1 hypothetical protein ABB37_09216 [Leptomonas pyrrhocoris]KPA74586.1 hypothetical protein ABB37_09216 [Leptomonas pyrrhocoris]KPA74589.1 hypothetical protein ABB37_09219 [Leptomonas pyrrhocoris]|eukprot:XP_015653024.1 hypothetical protein ABB37_09216 [Leptomonas pyrrhocoris]
MKFLQALVTAVPDLKFYKKGTDYCVGWDFVQCVRGVATKVKLTGLKLAHASSLPDLADDVNGALVTVTGFEANDIGAMLSGTLPPSWGRLTQMQRISLSGNALTGQLPVEWSGMASLKILWLGNNKLSGTLPAVWSSLSKLMQLKLNNNSLSGTLPAEWSKLTRVKNGLLLQGNHFCGCVPPEWAGKLTPTVDPAVSAETCATTNACDKASSSGAGPHSSSHSSPSPSSASSSHSSFHCTVLHCFKCDAGNGTKCMQCTRGYMLTDDFECASISDGACRQSVSDRNGWLMLALLCTSVLWNLV